MVRKGTIDEWVNQRGTVTGSSGDRFRVSRAPVQVGDEGTENLFDRKANCETESNVWGRVGIAGGAGSDGRRCGRRARGAGRGIYV